MTKTLTLILSFALCTSVMAYTFDKDYDYEYSYKYRVAFPNAPETTITCGYGKLNTKVDYDSSLFTNLEKANEEINTMHNDLMNGSIEPSCEYGIKHDDNKDYTGAYAYRIDFFLSKYDSFGPDANFVEFKGYVTDLGTEQMTPYSINEKKLHIPVDLVIIRQKPPVKQSSIAVKAYNGEEYERP